MSVVYYWYDHLLLRKNGDAKKVQEAIRTHDLDAFNAIKSKYEPNKRGLLFFPDSATVFDDETCDVIGELDITTPEGFNRIDESGYECG